MQRCVRTLPVVWLIAGLTAFAGSGGSGPQVELLYRVGRDHAGHCPVEKVREILAKRVTAYGCRRATVAVQGNDHVLVRLSARDPATLRLLRSVIESVGHLEFRLVADPESRPGEQWVESGKAQAPPGYTTYVIRTLAAGAAVSQKVLVSDRAEMTGAFSEQEAKALRTVLMAGALPAPVVLERQTPVEP